jgi:hypothetical protein
MPEGLLFLRDALRDSLGSAVLPAGGEEDGDDRHAIHDFA